MASIYAVKGGTIAAVRVREGDHVAVGQVLVEISLQTSGANGALGARLRQELERRLTELTQQGEAVTERYRVEIARLSNRSIHWAEEIEQLQARLTVEQELLKVAQDDLARWSSLIATSAVSRMELSQRKQQVLLRTGAIHDIERQIIVRSHELSDNDMLLRALPLERDERQSQLRAQHAEIRQSLAELDVAESYFLVAPVAGTVAALQARPGQAAHPNMPVVSLLPEGVAMEVVLLVPSRSAGLVASGQDVRLRIDSFPFQRFGHLAGQINTISQSTYKPEELDAPIVPSEPVYKATVSLKDNEIRAYGRTKTLSSGMTLQGSIVIDRRTFIDIIFDPLRSAIGSRPQWL